MNATRIFTESRKLQGFRSQGHLDAWFAAYDHANTCPDCQGTSYAECHDGLQPVSIRCPKWKELDQIEARIDRD